VYVMVASEARLGREPSQGEFDQKTHAHHKAMLKTLGKSVLFRTAAHFHAKVVLIDPYTRPAGVLLTANLTEGALTRNEELAVRLSPTQVEGIAGYLRWAMWQTAEHELLNGKDFKAAKPIKDCRLYTPPTPRWHPRHHGRAHRHRATLAAGVEQRLKPHHRQQLRLGPATSDGRTAVPARP